MKHQQPQTVFKDVCIVFNMHVVGYVQTVLWAVV